MMRSLVFTCLGLAFFFGLKTQAETSFSFDTDSSSINHHYNQDLYRRLKIPNIATKPSIPDEASDPRVRSHQEGILSISGTSFSPFRINVKVGPVGVVGTIELTKRNETNSRWFFRAENIRDDQNIWDARGRAVLVPGKVTCQVSHRVSINDYKQAGLTLGIDAKVPGISANLEAGASSEQIRSDFFEGEDICSLGTIAAFTPQQEIENKCKKCLGKVLETIKQDVNARLSFLNYYVNTPVCKDDSECYRENGDWSVGRCTLVKDKHNSFYSECRAKSTIGGACPGKGSRGLFEFACDTGLACVKVESASGWFDYNRYECRDPKNWKFKGPSKLLTKNGTP